MATMEYRFLPEEIVDQICASVDRSTLVQLCLASKTLNRIATARLYSHIQVGHFGYVGEEDSHVIPLAYLFLKSPAHAALVSSVDVVGTWGRMEENEDWCDQLSWPEPEKPETKELLRSACAKYASTDELRDELYSAIESGTEEDAILALLLASLPNLRRLDINFGCGEDHDEFVWLGKLCGQPTMTTRLEPVLLDVMVRGDDDKYPHNPIHLITFFQLPNVRTIYGYKMGNEEGTPDLGSLTLKPRSCPVETIELRTSKLHSDVFKSLIATTIPGRLKTFNYEIGCSWAWCTVEHPVIMESLACHRSTLENLGLSHERSYPYQNDNSDDVATPCSFVEFTALKRLKVAPVFIWGHHALTGNDFLGGAATHNLLWQILPKNLEELWITRAEHQNVVQSVRFEPVCLFPALDLVIQHKTEAFPKLSHLRVEFPPGTWDTEWFPEFASICERARTNGIECTLILTDVQRRTQDTERNWGWNEDVEWSWIVRNQEARKHWVVTADEKDLIQTLRDMKMRADAEKAGYK